MNQLRNGPEAYDWRQRLQLATAQVSHDATAGGDERTEGRRLRLLRRRLLRKDLR